MAIRTLAHVSDLHLGMHPDNERAAASLCATLIKENVDHVVITGDLTHRGRVSELRCFYRIFAPLLAEGRLTIVPGDRDRLGNDVAPAIQPGARVSIATADGLHIVRFDSSAHLHRPGPAETCVTTEEDLAAIVDAVVSAPDKALVVLMMHHPLLPLLAQHDPQRLLASLARDYHAELERAYRLLAAIGGRCQLLLHGHGRPNAAVTPIAATSWSRLSVFNAGSSTQLCRMRLFWHEEGCLTGQPAWLGTSVATDTTSPWRRRRSPLTATYARMT